MLIFFQDFDLEVDGAKTLRVICYDHTKGLDDEMIDKGQTLVSIGDVVVTCTVYYLQYVGF